jgi:glucose/arabinose dehydrogenase
MKGDQIMVENRKRVGSVVAAVVVMAVAASAVAPGSVTASATGSAVRPVQRPVPDLAERSWAGRALRGSAVGSAADGQPVASAPPSGFSDVVIANVAMPTALAWTPDRRMLVAGKGGRLWVFRESGRRTLALDLSSSLCRNVERGLVGLAVDPRFSVNHFIYLYWTRNAHDFCGRSHAGRNPENRVTRHVLRDDDTVAAGSMTVLADHIESPRPHHVAGDLEFAGGLLYVTTGDGVCRIAPRGSCGATNNNSLRRDLPHGKVLRFTRRGFAPSSNPYANAPGARRCTRPAGVPPGSGPCKEIFASGFRNPFRFARQPGTTAFFVNDVGENTWEEINRLAKGANYGWNVREGHCMRGSRTRCGPTAYRNPLHDYPHAACRSVTGGAFVPRGLWPAPYSGSYLYADWTCGTIFRLVRRADGTFGHRDFITRAGGPVHLRFGPFGDTQALYYLDFNNDAVHRVMRTGANTAPIAGFTYRPDGLRVAFAGTSSYDPDGGDRVVGWTWDFGDGSPAVTTRRPRITHLYPAAQEFEATLTVTDSHGIASTPVSRTVLAGEHVPTISILEPPTTARFSVGQRVTATATATDSEDGVLPGTSITWVVRLRHDTHAHPYAGPVNGSAITVRYPPPHDLLAATNSHLVVIATATDSGGFATAVARDLLPRKVRLTFVTSPAGGWIRIDGARAQTRTSRVSWPGHVFGVRAPDQSFDGVPYVFRSWSDGGARAHDIHTPAGPTTYRARFRPR